MADNTEMDLGPIKIKITRVRDHHRLANLINTTEILNEIKASKCTLPGMVLAIEIVKRMQSDARMQWIQTYYALAAKTGVDLDLAAKFSVEGLDVIVIDRARAEEDDG